MPRLSVTAMENWGLVTYSESDLLYEEGTSSEFHKEGIAKLIAHELAHQVCLFKVATFTVSLETI